MSRIHNFKLIENNQMPESQCVFNGLPVKKDDTSYLNNSGQIPAFMDNFSGLQDYQSQQDSAITNIVDQFTAVLQNVFSILQQTVSGLFDILNAQQAGEVPAATDPAAQPTPATDTTPAPAAPDTTATDSSSKADKKDAKALAKTGEFLWKPVSEKDGKLAVLLPSNLTSKIKSVKIVNADGKVLAKGKYSGVGNGDREHYRFDKKGASYPDGSVVQINLKNGNTRKVTIKETSERYTR